MSSPSAEELARASKPLRLPMCLPWLNAQQTEPIKTTIAAVSPCCPPFLRCLKGSDHQAAGYATVSSLASRFRVTSGSTGWPRSQRAN